MTMVQPVVNTSGVAIDEIALEAFKAHLEGQLIRPGDATYDASRKLWNGMIDKRPGAIVRCADTADVRAAVNFARDHSLVLAVRGGGHNVAGKASCDGGLVIDLSAMKGMSVDAATQRVRAQTGLLWCEFDRATQAHGLATTGGVVSHTGIAGLTLGGGVGWLAHRYGLSSDNLLSAEIVTADGELRTANADEHADLFWAIRGAGANFGVVTAFEYRLHPVDAVVGGMLLYPVERARQGLKFYRDYCHQMPDDMGTAAALLTGPDGHRVFAIVVCYYGPPEGADTAVKPLRAFDTPLADLVAPIPYTKMQSLLDEAMAPGFRSYWKSHLLARIDDGLIDAVLSGFAEVPSSQTAIIFQQIGGAVKQIPRDRTAFAHRDADFDFVILSLWSDPTDDERNIMWSRELGDQTRLFASGGVYVNNLGDEAEDRVRAAYGSNYDRLVALKSKYDPANLFRLNQNLRPRPQDA